MKIYRYNTISTLPGVMELQIDDITLHQDFTDSLADKSQFVPVSDSVRSLPIGDVSPSYFTFPDGKDTGGDIPPKRGRDIAEIYESTVELSKNTAKKVTDKANDLAFDDKVQSLQKQ